MFQKGPCPDDSYTSSRFVQFYSCLLLHFHCSFLQFQNTLIVVSLSSQDCNTICGSSNNNNKNITSGMFRIKLSPYCVYHPQCFIRTSRHQVSVNCNGDIVEGNIAGSVSFAGFHSPPPVTDSVDSLSACSTYAQLSDTVYTDKTTDLYQLTGNSKGCDVGKGKSHKCFVETLKHHEELHKLACVIPNPEEHPDSGIITLFLVFLLNKSI